MPRQRPQGAAFAPWAKGEGGPPPGFPMKKGPLGAFLTFRF